MGNTKKRCGYMMDIWLIFGLMVIFHSCSWMLTIVEGWLIVVHV